MVTYIILLYTIIKIGRRVTSNHAHLPYPCLFCLDDLICMPIPNLIDSVWHVPISSPLGVTLRK